jgi:hypothetical protein
VVDEEPVRCLKLEFATASLLHLPPCTIYSLRALGKFVAPPALLLQFVWPPAASGLSLPSSIGAGSRAPMSCRQWGRASDAAISGGAGGAIAVAVVWVEGAAAVIDSKRKRVAESIAPPHP